MKYGDNLHVFEVNDKVAGIINMMDEGENMFDYDETTPTKISGLDKYKGYVPWGSDNLLPNNILEKIRKDEVMSQNKLFNILTCYASGISVKPKNEEQELAEEVKNFFKYNRLPRYFLEQATDMKHFFFTVSIIILNNEGTKIVKLRHKEAQYCRFETCNTNGCVEHVFFANWEKNPSKDEIEVIETLDVCDPIGDLEVRLGKKPNDKGQKLTPTKTRKFAVINAFPVPGSKYYPMPYYCSVFNSGWYDIKQMIPAGKKAKFKNHAQIKYLVELHPSYWDKLFELENITKTEEKVERVKKEKEAIKTFVCGIENSGKLWITGTFIDPVKGALQSLINIKVVDNSKEGGDWIEDSEEAANMLCYADNIHPNLVGAAPGKSKGGFSGSVQRELFTIKQALEKAYHDILLEPLFVIKEFNGWKDVVFDVPVITLTTLDKGKDAEENTLREAP